MNLTEELTARYEYERQHRLRSSAAEQGVNLLLDAAWQTDPSRARRALHVAMYSQRIGRAMGAGSRARRLRMLGLLSVLATDAAQEYAVFEGFRADEWSDRILTVAHAFESAVEAFGADAQASPADAMRFMMRRPERYDAHVVLALRRALGGRQAAPVKARSGIAANQSGP